MKNYQIVFYSDCTSLHSYQQYVSVPVSSHSFPTLICLFDYSQCLTENAIICVLWESASCWLFPLVFSQILSSWIPGYFMLSISNSITKLAWIILMLWMILSFLSEGLLLLLIGRWARTFEIIAYFNHRLRCLETLASVKVISLFLV